MEARNRGHKKNKQGGKRPLTYWTPPHPGDPPPPGDQATRPQEGALRRSPLAEFRVYCIYQQDTKLWYPLKFHNTHTATEATEV